MQGSHLKNKIKTSPLKNLAINAQSLVHSSHSYAVSHHKLKIDRKWILYGWYTLILTSLNKVLAYNKWKIKHTVNQNNCFFSDQATCGTNNRKISTRILWKYWVCLVISFSCTTRSTCIQIDSSDPFGQCKKNLFSTMTDKQPY